MEFNGSGDQVIIDTLNDPVFDFTGDFTIETWVKAPLGSTYQPIATKYEDLGGGMKKGFWLGTTPAGTPILQVFDGASISVCSW